MSTMYTTSKATLLILLLTVTGSPLLVCAASNETTDTSGLLPGCCDLGLPSQSKGVVQKLLTSSANATGSTAFTPFTSLNTSSPWRWNFAAVQLNSTVANGTPRPSTQFALATWLDAPGLWDDENANWDEKFELCAARVTFFAPRSERERMGYNSTIPDAAPGEFGGCQAAFERSECAQDIKSKIIKLYQEGGCTNVGRLVIDPKCAPNQGTITRPFVVAKGKTGKEDFQRKFFDSSAGRKEGVTLGQGTDADNKKIREVWGSVVNEVRPLVLVGKEKGKQGATVDVRMACVKGERMGKNTMEAIAGPETKAQAMHKAVSRSVMGAVMGFAVAVTISMI